MVSDRDTIDKMIEREKYRKIAEKYRSHKNDRYRNYVRRKNNGTYKGNKAESGFRLPVRLIAGAVVFAAFALYINSGNADDICEKVRAILDENISFDVIEKTGAAIGSLGKKGEIKIDEKTLEEMEEDTYIPEYP